MAACLALAFACIGAGCEAPDRGEPPRVAADGIWQALSADGAPAPRTFYSKAPTAVWTGDAMIVWGGVGGDPVDGVWLRDGGSYDPSADRWVPVPAEGAPAVTSPHTAFWTVDGMIVWGLGRAPSGGVRPLGATYDPGSRTWSDIAGFDVDEGSWGQHVAVWTGGEMLVWGFPQLIDGTVGGQRYDLASDTWRPVSRIGAPVDLANRTAVWTGEEMIVWGGADNQGADAQAPGGADESPYGARYASAADGWTPVTQDGAPCERFGAVIVWTGTEMVVWGGHGASTGLLGDGAAYDPATDTWRSLSNDGAPSPRIVTVGVWTGSEVLVWGGWDEDADTCLDDTFAYDPAGDRWRELHPAGEPPWPCGGPATAWTGDALLVWGGGAANHTFLGSGARLQF